jgi:oligopeptide transport system ATP-binding protein
MPDLESKEKLFAIPGTPPDMHFPPVGDAFAPRNKYAMKIDLDKHPPVLKIPESHYAATWLLHEFSPKVKMPASLDRRIKRNLKRNKANKEVK